MSPRQALKVLATQFNIAQTLREDNLSYEQVQARNALTVLARSVNEYEREKRLKKYN